MALHVGFISIGELDVERARYPFEVCGSYMPIPLPHPSGAALSGEAQEGHVGPLRRTMWLSMSPLYVLESLRLKGLDILLRIVEVVYEHPLYCLPP